MYIFKQKVVQISHSVLSYRAFKYFLIVSDALLSNSRKNIFNMAHFAFRGPFDANDAFQYFARAGIEMIATLVCENSYLASSRAHFLNNSFTIQKALLPNIIA